MARSILSLEIYSLRVCRDSSKISLPRPIYRLFMSHLTFTVDTHLFRELGRLLVGRDSTALVELIKNAYDADAQTVVVHGEHLDKPNSGTIVITDDGTGMNEEDFRQGFLRIASRMKDSGQRRSSLYKRRYTGAKGVGRLAAHKLARHIEIDSNPRSGRKGVIATIDWDIVEEYQTLDDLVNSEAVTLETPKLPTNVESGTAITLSKLRKKWSEDERARLFSEIQTFNPPDALLEIPSSVIDKDKLLFDEPNYRDTDGDDPGFKVKLTGDLEAGEDYWQNLAQTAQWIIEIDARRDNEKVTFNILPTKQGKKEFPLASRKKYYLRHLDPQNGPFFQGRIYIREGGIRRNSTWPAHASGVRVYMEGFRVLPYGEPSDDWLSIDSAYGARNKTLGFLKDFDFGDAEDENEGLVRLNKKSYFGAIFLTAANTPSLEMLVNREGFIPNQSYLNLVRTVQVGIDLSVRVRAAAKAGIREERREERREATREQLRQSVESTVFEAANFASNARKLAAEGDFNGAVRSINRAAESFQKGSEISERLLTEGSVLRILASVGTQMTAFVHEMNAILGSASALEGAIERIREADNLPNSIRTKLGRLQKAVKDLRRSVERHASYLTDITSADARRRRSRQTLAERFDSAVRLFDSRMQRANIEVMNEIPPTLKSPPMFPAELTVIFSNLLSNAVKAVRQSGRIRAIGEATSDGIVIRVENTGKRVDVKKSERWFRPFESTTVETDPLLGQGMGMGLTITRNMLEEYGGSISFVEPTNGFATALELKIPN